MARPTKTGLDYFPFDIDFFDDDKVQFLTAKFGLVGEAIAIRLLSKIYRNGYYMTWTEDDKILFSNRLKLTTNEDVNEIADKVVKELLNRSFFDKEMFKKNNILTSKGIQKRYNKICENVRRKDYLIIPEFSLLGINPQKTPVNSELMAVNSEETPVNSEFSTQIKQNKIKEKEIKQNYKETPCSNDDNFSLQDISNFNFYSSQVENLFITYVKPEPNFEADIKPVMRHISEPREGLNFELAFDAVKESFLILHQGKSENKTTRYLLGIIERKIAAKQEDVLKSIKKVESSQGFIDRKITKKNDDEKKRKNEEKLRGLNEFFEKNRSLFNPKETETLKDGFLYDQLDVVTPLIEAKMQALEL